MKKATVISLILCLTVTLFAVTPSLARPDHFWPGVAIGVGAAILLDQLFHAPRVYAYDNGLAQGYHPPVYYGPSFPPPSPRERWIPGHWVGGYDAIGNWNRYWVSEHWEKT